jgi:uncharacterized membrane protein HdeD (DUF308 family)
MLQALAQNWWLLLVRGLLAIAFGVMAFVWPGITLWVLVMLYGIYAVADGITALVLAFSGRTGAQAWWAMLLVGLLGIAAGVIAFVWPGLTAAVLLVIIASWAIVRGVFEIIAAIRLRKAIDNEWLLALAGVVSIAWGIALLVWPAAGLLALVWLIGAAAIISGCLMIALSLRLRGLRERREHAPLPPGARPAL